MKIDVPYLKLRVTPARAGRLSDVVRADTPSASRPARTEVRPRWEPGPGVRNFGFKGRDLKDEAGRWLTIDAAIAAARVLNDEVAAFRASGQRRWRPSKPMVSAHSCRHCWDAFTKSLWHAELAPRTARQYGHAIEHFLAAEFGDAPVRSVTRPHLIAYYQREHDARGRGMANLILATVSILFSHAERIGWRDENSNPAFRMKKPGLDPRVVLWTPAEIERLVAIADSTGRASVGDAIVIALHTAQRAGDVLALEAPVISGQRARFDLVQGKRKARVSVPLTDQLAARIEAIRRRRQAGGVVTLRPDGPLVVREDGTAYATLDYSAFAKEFREVRRQAGRDMPAIAGKQFLDLRDTAITRLALAECTLAEIRAISGHSLKTITTVLAHYLVMDEVMADAAIDKLKTWIAREGIAL